MQGGEVAQQLLSAPLGLQFLDLVSDRDPNTLTNDDLSHLLRRAGTQISIYASDYHDRLLMLKSRSEQLREWAEWLPKRAHFWWDDLDRSRQCWWGPRPKPPTRSNLRVDLMPFGPEVPKPKRAFWTSTLNLSAGSPWIDSAVFSASTSSEPHSLWKLTASDSARVFEVHSPAAWAELARTFAGKWAAYRWSGNARRSDADIRLDPDWTMVATAWDGVHVSVAGLLTAEDLPFRVDGDTSELRGWNVESTAWLRWAFVSTEQVDSGPTHKS